MVQSCSTVSDCITTTLNQIYHISQAMMLACTSNVPCQQGRGLIVSICYRHEHAGCSRPALCCLQVSEQLHTCKSHAALSVPFHEQATVPVLHSASHAGPLAPSFVMQSSKVVANTHGCSQARKTLKRRVGLRSSSNAQELPLCRHPLLHFAGRCRCCSSWGCC